MFATKLLRNRKKRGMSLVVVSAFVVTAASFAVLAIGTTESNYQSTRSRVESQRAFYVAEGGVDFCLAQFPIDPFWAARSTTEFPTVTTDGAFVSKWRTLGGNAGRFRMKIAYSRANDLPAGWTGPGLPSSFEPFTTVPFANRASDRPQYDRVLLEITAEVGRARKTVRANVQLQFTAYGAAIVSDAVQVSGSSSGKSLAIDKAGVVFSGDKQYVYGGMRANGGVFLDSTTKPITTANAATLLTGFNGTVKTNLLGTDDEIPDYTNEGSPNQIFDFARFKAAAAAGRGSVFTSLASFYTAMNAANTAGKPLEGIIYLVVDCSKEGSSPKMQLGDMPDGINIKGTLVFDFVNPPDKFYKIFGEVPIRINAATYPGNFDASNPATFTTGYPPTISPSKDPRGFDLAPYGFKSFAVDDDLPAMMYQTGTVDIHQEANICGAVYGPSYIEIENKHNARQYFNGILIGGGGVLVDGSPANGAEQIFYFDPNAVDALATVETAGRTPVIKNYLIGE